ncbi:hypothetical protein [Mycolicibacterium thermoresistibile]
MFARSTTLQAHPSSVDAGIAHIRDEVMPELATLPGYVGLSLLVDRQSGQCIATSAWDSEAARHDSAEPAHRLRHRAAEIFRSPEPKVEDWEIAVLHREHAAGHAACVRATWIKLVPDQRERSLDYYRTAVLPSVEELEGFCSASLLIDSAGRRAVSSTTFDSQEAMERNREQATALRTARLRELGAEALDVGEFELAIARLRVPELV